MLVEKNLLENGTADEIARAFSLAVNNFGFAPVKQAEVLKGSKEMKTLCLCWISTLLKPDYRTDGRNEASVQMAGRLIQFPFIKTLVEKQGEDVMWNVTKKISNQHRTLQETFSGFCFYYLFCLLPPARQKNLTDELGKRFYHLPLI